MVGWGSCEWGLIAEYLDETFEVGLALSVRMEHTGTQLDSI